MEKPSIPDSAKREDSNPAFKSLWSSLSPEARRIIEDDKTQLKRRIQIVCLLSEQDSLVTKDVNAALITRIKNWMEANVVIQRILTREPEILKVDFIRPVIQVTMHRCGSTTLQRLMAADTRWVSPLMWEMENVHDLHSQAPGPAIQKHHVDLEEIFSPDFFSHVHLMNKNLPEETSCISSLLLFTGELPLYIGDYYATHLLKEMSHDDHVRVYEYIKNLFQIIVKHRNYSMAEGQRLVLKNHASLHMLDALLEVFPGAQIIMGHRDPVEFVPSLCSLSRTLIDETSPPVNKDYLGMKMHWLAYNGCMMHMKKRQKILEEYREKGIDTTNLFIDYSYKTFMQDPIGTTRDIYSKLDMSWTDEVDGMFRKYMSHNKQGKHGAHNYTLEEYGLSKEYIHTMWKPYYDAFKEYL